MRKAMLVFTDQDEAGNVGVSLEFDPPLKGDEKVTPAIGLAFDALKFIQSRAYRDQPEEE